MSKFCADKIRIKSVRAYYDDTSSTEIQETETMLFYKTQTFYCKVELELPSSTADRDWTIGLVQACDFMHLANDYSGMGKSLWEFHPLKSGLRKLINDSDGQQYPFYSVNQSLHNIKRGPVKKTSLTLQIKDYFHPSVVWELPYAGGVQLTEIDRQQKFLIWLIAVKYGKRLGGRDEVTVLKRVRWSYNLHMKIDTSLPLGSRVRSICDRQVHGSVMHDSDKSYRLPVSSTLAPHCNAAQSLIWYPKDRQKHPRILVPPKQIIVSWEDWVRDMLGPSARVRRPTDVTELGDTQICVSV